VKITVNAEGTILEVAQELYSVANALTGNAIPGTKAPKGKKVQAAPVEEKDELDLDDTSDTDELDTEEDSDDLDLDMDSDDDELDEEVEEKKPKKSAVATITLEQVLDAAKKYAKKHSREKAAKVLKKFKVASVRDLKPAQFKEALQALS
jgi:hypothetical protein